MADLKELLTQDIKRQKDVAEEALRKAQELDRVLQDPNTDQRAKDQLQQARNTLLEIARSLAANTTSTSSAAVEIIRKSRN